MYLYEVLIKDSSIEGKGVFAAGLINKDSIVWKFDSSSDKIMSKEEFSLLDRVSQEEIEKVGYLSPFSGNWIYPSENDPARFTNHHASKNNLSVVFDISISNEPVFVANREIAPGEELLVNYKEFDDFVKLEKPFWL